MPVVADPRRARPFSREEWARVGSPRQVALTAGLLLPRRAEVQQWPGAARLCAAERAVCAAPIDWTVEGYRLGAAIGLPRPGKLLQS